MDRYRRKAEGGRVPQRLQFNLRQLAWTSAVLCVVLSVPGGYVLLAWFGGWIAVGGGVLASLLLLQLPLYLVMERLVRRDRRSD